MSTSSSNTRYGNRYSVDKTNNKGGGKFCKICKDTGKSLDEYTSHYVRETPDPNSKVVCPTLIAAVCRYCKNGGHTVKHCPKIQAKNRQEHKKNDHIISRNYCKETTDSKKVKETDNFRSAFSVLDYDDNEDDEDIESTTPVTSPSSDIKKDNVISYASILKKPAAVASPAPAPAPPSPPSKKEENLAVSQVESLIPTKLDFSQEVNTENVVTLFDVTGKWSDEEDIEDCSILEIVYPTLNQDHPLYHYNRWLNANSITKFTDEYTKNMRVTEDAFSELFERWDKDYFDNNNGLKASMNTNNVTNKNSRRMSVIMNFTK